MNVNGAFLLIKRFNLIMQMVDDSFLMVINEKLLFNFILIPRIYYTKITGKIHRRHIFVKLLI